MRPVTIIGAGMTKFGRSDISLLELMSEASLAALHHADLGNVKGDGVVVANMGAARLNHQTAIASALVETEVPQALLGESGEYQGDGTRKLYSMELASSVNFVAGAYYWIGYVYSGDDDYDTSIYGAWFDAWGSWAYDVGDTYSDGPDDPCNTPEEWDGSWGLAMFAEEAAGEAATTAQDGILFAIL